MSLKKTEEFIFEWDIPNFSFDFYKPGDAIESPVFQVDSFGKSQWKIEIYPLGEDEENHEYLSCYLFKTKNDIYSEECSLSYDLELYVDGKSLIKENKPISIYKLDEGYGWDSFVLKETVSCGLKEWPENILTLRCHMFNISTRNCPDLKLRTEIPVNRYSFMWNLKISKITPKTVSKDIVFTETSVYEITLREHKDAIQICMKQKGDKPPTFSLLVACKLSLVGSKGKQLKSGNFRYLFKTNILSDIWEFPPFITSKDADDDTFHLFCEVSSSIGTNSASDISSKSGEGNSTILQDLRSMLHKSIYFDVKLKSGNEILNAHKCILASRSPVFTAMFAQGMIESKTNVVDISDFESNVLKLFLKFLYTDTVVNLDCDKARNLLVIADKYQVSTLTEKCATFLESNLSLENATKILSVADLISHGHLKKLVLNFIAVNSAMIFNTPEWKDLIQENIELAAEMFSLIASNYKVIFRN